MPTPSKFTEARRRVVVAALGCGASRRTAAKLAGVDHATLGRWIARGRIAVPGGRWREFADAVERAEAQPRPQALLPLPQQPSASEVRWAAEFLARTEWRADDAPRPPTVIRLTLEDI